MFKRFTRCKLFSESVDALPRKFFNQFIKFLPFNRFFFHLSCCRSFPFSTSVHLQTISLRLSNSIYDLELSCLVLMLMVMFSKLIRWWLACVCLSLGPGPGKRTVSGRGICSVSMPLHHSSLNSILNVSSPPCQPVSSFSYLFIPIWTKINC